MIGSLSVFLALLAIWSGPGPQREMDAREPLMIILPPPPFIDAKEEKGKLRVRFREIGIDRVEKYSLYKKRDGTWHLLGSVQIPPATLSSCTAGDTSYAIAAIDKSQREGSKTRFAADLNCSKVETEKPK